MSHLSLHILQANYWDSPLSLQSAQYIIQCKCWNMWHLLKGSLAYRQRVYPDQALLLQRDIASIRTIADIMTKNAPNRHALFLYEARATRAYWDSIRLLTRQGRHWHRIYPHATDPLNTALNVGYSFLASRIQIMLQKHKFSLEIGMLHTPQRFKEALVYDLEELFRQPVVDAAIIPLFTRHQEAPSAGKVVLSIQNQLNRRLRYQDNSVPLHRVMSLEVERFLRAIQQQTLYVPIPLSWAHKKVHA